MAETPPPTMIVKIGSAGDVHLDLKPSSIESMQEGVTRLNESHGVVIYYCESPYRTSSESAMASFKQLLALKPRILMGQNARSEWGRLDWVEVQRNPVVSRVFFGRGEKFLISPAATPEQPDPRRLIGGPLEGENQDAMFKAIDLVIRCARVMETPQREPSMAMNDNAVGTPSLHIRLAYAGRRWASAYPIDEVPSNIASFDQDVCWLVNRLFVAKAGVGRKLSDEEALSAFDGAKKQ